MAIETEIEQHIDGRTARAVRTRLAIVDACLDLIDEGDLRPTGPRIAERAGVSVRSVFQHFDDLDALFLAVGERVVTRIAAMIHRIDPAAPLDQRAGELVAQRSDVLEALSPVLRAALLQAASSEVIFDQFQAGQEFMVAQIEEVFAPELAGSARPGPLRDALVVAMSWTTWDQLRVPLGRSIDEARDTVAWMVRSALEAAARLS